MEISLLNISFYFLITCDNIISAEDMDNKETIIIYFISNENEEKRSIQINGRSHFTFFAPLNISLIEILDLDNISKDKFLLPDLNYKKGYELYLDKSYYIAGFENNNNNKFEKFICSCEIKPRESVFEKFSFIHTINKGSEASGSLICLKNNFHVIGINREGISLNSGAFIGPILDHLDNNRRNIEVRQPNMYIGYLSLGIRHGKGTGYYNDGGLYEGDWVNDSREGKGTMYYPNGNIYIGDWKNNRREGNGIFYFCKGGSYNGEFKNNIIDGFGKLKGTNYYFTGKIDLPFLDDPNFSVDEYFNLIINL